MMTDTTAAMRLVTEALETLEKDSAKCAAL